MKSYLSFSVIARLVACVLLLWALDRHPYGFYTLLRWVTCGTAAYCAYMASSAKRTPWVWSFGFLAILFNPVIPVTLDRQTWAPVDVIAAVFLFVSIFFVRESVSAKAVKQTGSSKE